ncbi:MAG: DUF262 domain-containing protein [Clostridiales bacterium]|nr:DUF262 domain-containing protein [Clostridiales bacterium]
MKWESYSHPISDIKDWDKNNRLELRPDFQRNEVWTRSAQIMLIDTIIKGIPIPKIYIKSIIKEGNTYRVVIDGQQRLTAILKFVNNRLTLSKPYSGDFIGKKFDDLPVEIKNEILRYKIDINEIFSPTDEEIRDLYARVNKYTVQLNKQELRRADFPGDFINMAEELAELPLFENGKIFTVKQRRRMQDVEFIEELLTILLEGIKDKKEYLDDICEKYMSLENKEEIKEKFIKIISDIDVIFSDELQLSKTRFKQKSDFYSLFACIFELQKSGVLSEDKLSSVRAKLQELSDKVEPQSEIEIYREYAIRCLSDANAVASREWRTNYLKDIIKSCYTEDADGTLL